MTVRVKVCGITRLEDGLLAADCGAWALGFVFWPGSPRFLDPYRARAIVRALPPFVTPIGVFVDQPAAYVESVANLVDLGAVQLHGRERPDGYAGMRRRVIKAVAVAPDAAGDAAGEVPAGTTVLLDAHDPIARGGTGRTIDWTVAAGIARRRRVVLSGGLSPENVVDAIAAVRPYGVDVSSGVEVRPGVKDGARVRAFLDAVHRAAREGAAVEGAWPRA